MTIPSSLLPTTASVYRATITQNDIGAPVKTYAEIIETLACRIRQLRASEIVPVADADGVTLTHRLYCNPTTAIQVMDEVRVGAVVYTVGAVNNVDQVSEHWEIDMAETRPDRHGR